MAGFQDVIGHEQIIEHLQSAIQLQKVSHAYIFDGEKGSGKNFLANIFAMTLQCEQQGTNPCGECKSCKQAEGANHPDIIRVTHEKPNTISVDDIREQVCADIQIRPYKGPYKIYIIDEAEKLNVQAQNALLKTIEEPPAYAVILLLTVNSEKFLPTILSRCVTLHLKPTKDNLVRKFLMEEVKIPDYEADICVAFAQGNIGKAKRLAVSEEFGQMKEHMLRLVKYIHDMPVSEMIKSMKKIAEFKTDISDYLDLITVWYRDVLLYKATMNASSLVFSDEIMTVEKQAAQSSYEGIENILHALDKAKIRLAANVNFDLTMELLLLTMKEN
ncbi:MAG: DNA polymerase III subunit delta' [Lachnospiraceae bacterium]